MHQLYYSRLLRLLGVICGVLFHIRVQKCVAEIAICRCLETKKWFVLFCRILRKGHERGLGTSEKDQTFYLEDSCWSKIDAHNCYCFQENLLEKTFLSALYPALKGFGP